MKTNQKLRSFSLVSSNLTLKAMQVIAKNLKKATRRLAQLSFRFCFLNLIHVETLCQGLMLTRSLVKLDLSNNGLNSYLGIFVIKRITVKKILILGKFIFTRLKSCQKRFG